MFVSNVPKDTTTTTTTATTIITNSPCACCVPLAIKTITIVLLKILALSHFKALKSSWLTLNDILIALIAKGTQGVCRSEEWMGKTRLYSQDRTLWGVVHYVLLRVRICAAHMGGFLGQNCLNKVSLFGRFFINMGGLSRN